MVSFSANIRMSPIGLFLIFVTSTSMIFYFHDMIGNSKPIKKLSSLAKLLRSQGYNVVGFHVDEISMKQLLVASIEVAERGGFEVKKVRQSNELKETSKGNTDEGINDPLTQGDLLSHRVMYHSFKISWPSLRVISEEKDNVVPEGVRPVSFLPVEGVDGNLISENDIKVPLSDIVVWIDPLDATKEFAEDLREYVTTMVCVTVKGKPKIGVIHKPFTGQTYWAWNGHGNNIKLIKQKTNLQSPVIIVSRSHAGNINATARKAFGNDIKVIPAGGAGYKVLSLVEGAADVYIHSTKIKKWDVCAGNAILNSMYGKMTDLLGQNIEYNDKDDIVLNHGLIASMTDHENFVEKLGNL
eukprot:gene4581-5181_t